MQTISRLLSFILALSSAINCSAVESKESVNDLPSGQYLYLGVDGTISKPFEIDKPGEFSWKVGPMLAVSPVVSPIVQTFHQSPEMIDCKYPYISWVEKRIGKTKSVATIWTNYDADLVRCRLRLDHLTMIQDMSVQMLDKNGFKLFQMEFLAKTFQPVSNSTAFEAQGSYSFDENSYRRVRSYLVGPHMESATPSAGFRRF